MCLDASEVCLAADLPARQCRCSAKKVMLPFFAFWPSLFERVSTVTRRLPANAARIGANSISLADAGGRSEVRPTSRRIGCQSTVVHDAKPTGHPAPAEAVCKPDLTEKKSSKIKRESRRVSRTGYTVTKGLSEQHCTPLNEEVFDRLVDSMGVRGLRERFPHEHSCHTAMCARAKANKAVVHPDLKPFKSFLRYLKAAPSNEHTIDRIDNADIEYAPGKIRWATKNEQANNRSTTITLPFLGQRVPLSVVAEETGQNPDTMRKRLIRGWRAEEVVAGRRFAEAPALSHEGWPAGVVVSQWEGPYQGWRKVFDGKEPAATRAVFFCWIGQNRLDACSFALERAFPDLFHPEYADPDDEAPLPQEVIVHPAFRARTDLVRMLDEAQVLVSSDPRQCMLLSDLRRSRHATIDPKAARQAMSHPRTRPFSAKVPRMAVPRKFQHRQGCPVSPASAKSPAPQPPLTAEDFPPGYDWQLPSVREEGNGDD